MLSSRPADRSGGTDAIRRPGIGLIALVERMSAGEVVLVSRSANRAGHEYKTRAALAERIARLIGYDFGGDYDPAAPRVERYFVPQEMLRTREATALGIRSERDLFGAFAPHRFVGTKTITHPLVADGARCPDGWPHELGRELDGLTLHGYSAFAIDDVRKAIERILASTGQARIKLADASGGGGQYVVRDLAAADPLLPRLQAQIESGGAVVEEDLADTTTYSVGSVDLRGRRISYCGTQRATRARSGDLVYAGSDLFVVRGGFERLAGHGFDDRTTAAIDRALRYDESVTRATGVRASRRNYDVLHGIDGEGRERVAVLEQSWRLGGGTGAEIAAFEAFARDPGLASVRASTFELHTHDPPPPGAIVHFHDDAAEHGPFCKYSLLLDRDEPHGHPR